MTSRMLLLGAAAALLAGCEPWRCSASTCVNGCCDSTDTCIVNGGPPACGVGGAACNACTTCIGGVCGCEPGLTLVGGQCVCTAGSCPSGCCGSADSSLAAKCYQASAQSTTRCGTRGNACQYCAYPSTCGTSGCTTCDRVGEECTSGSCCSPYACSSTGSGSSRCY